MDNDAIAGAGDTAVGSRRLTPEEIAELQMATTILRTIASKINSLGAAPTLRNRISGALYHLAFEHCGSLIKLVRWGRKGSAMAMVRPAFESYMRATWVHYCAPDDLLEGITDNTQKFPSNGTMASAISSVKSCEAHGIITAINNFFPADIRHGLTHGGIEQIAARLDGQKIRPNFYPEAIVGTLRATVGIAAGSAMGMARQCGREDLAEEVATVLLRAIRSSIHGASSADKGD